MNNYIKEWSNEDFSGLPILGPMLGLLFEIVAYSDYDFLYSDFLESNVANNKVKVHKIFREIMEKIKNRLQMIE